MSSGISLGFLSFIERGQPASTVSIGGRLYPWRSSDRTKIEYRLAGQAKAQKRGKAIMFSPENGKSTSKRRVRDSG